MQPQVWLRSSPFLKGLLRRMGTVIFNSMNAPKGPAYTCDHSVAENGTVSFQCSRDVDAWPWLELAPQHPVVIQTQNYWSSVGASAALGTLEEGKWSALTWTDSKLGDRSAEHTARGTFTRTLVDDKLAFETRLFDDADRLIVTMRGRGVVFRNRNFEAWREGAKRELAGEAEQPAIVYAPRELLNLTPAETPLVSELDGDRASVLITRENGLMPAHRYFSGSGDHVNAPHLAEVARQIASQINQGAPLLVTGGEMDMYRYVELGIGFKATLLERDASSVTMEIMQRDKSCARLSMQWETVSG